MGLLSKALSAILAISFVACSGAENNAGKVLDNANSVVKSGSKKIWIDSSDNSPVTDEQKKKNEPNTL